MKSFIILLIFTCILGNGCGNAPPKNPSTPSAEPTLDTSENASARTKPKSQTTASPAPEQPIEDVSREELNAILQKGPAHILAMVQTDSVVENGKFVGFQIVSFRTKSPSILGIQPNDIVQKVNTLPVERPEQFLKIFETLKTAKNITFTIQRKGEQLTLRTPIE